MRIVFMGSSTFGLPALQLLHKKHEVVCVYTRPPKPSGRGMIEHKTPIHEFADQHHLPVVTPKTLRTETAASELAALKPDVVIVAAYGLILPQEILDVPLNGSINIHGSLLPKWRGAAPIHHALLAGDQELGVTIMFMEAGLDTGPMLKKGVVSNTGGFQTLHDATAQLGADLLIEVLDHLDTIIPEVQDESLSTYAHKVTKDDALITHDMPAQKVLNIIRTFGGDWGGRFMYKDELLMIHQAVIPSKEGAQENHTAPLGSRLRGNDNFYDQNNHLYYSCSDEVIEILSIQRSGKRIMTVKEFLNGFQPLIMV